MVFIKSKNDKYVNAEIKFSKKWHQYFIDKKRKDAFYFSSVIGGGGTDVDISNIISHVYKNIDQFSAPSMDDLKLTTQEQVEFNQLLSYRDLKRSIMLLNVMIIE
jgi:hypothetical protein